MLVTIEYTSTIRIDNTVIPVYVTTDNTIYVGMEIMPFLNGLNSVRQLLITDKSLKQYHVYPIVEVFKSIKEDCHITMEASQIKRVMHFETPKMEQHTLTSPITQNEFALFLKNTKKKK